MGDTLIQPVWLYGVTVALLMIVGLYCIVVTSNLIRALIGLEIIMKAVTLLITMVGQLTGNTAMAQSFVITLIVIEVVLMIVAGGLVISIFRKYHTIDVRVLRNLKG
ncbi:MAG TPA: NADH-quinone oxidoreductase subunit K [Spirochaetota bacterium]|nr:NADH-quinone oxidoreductase subunit K [Spirochaetota bacterium]